LEGSFEVRGVGQDQFIVLLAFMHEHVRFSPGIVFPSDLLLIQAPFQRPFSAVLSQPEVALTLVSGSTLSKVDYLVHWLSFACAPFYASFPIRLIKLQPAYFSGYICQLSGFVFRTTKIVVIFSDILPVVPQSRGLVEMGIECDSADWRLDRGAHTSADEECQSGKEGGHHIVYRRCLDGCIDRLLEIRFCDY
jgi:hypothetical protein